MTRKQITICEGYHATSYDDTRYVLLHEAAHLIVGTSEGHNEVFWSKCFDLCQTWNVNLEFAHQQALAYRPRGARKAIAAMTKGKA